MRLSKLHGPAGIGFSQTAQTLMDTLAANGKLLLKEYGKVKALRTRDGNRTFLFVYGKNMNHVTNSLASQEIPLANEALAGLQYK